MNPLQLHVAGATVRHESPFASLEVPVMEIPIEVIGAILNSHHAGHQVRVSDDSENTGGFLIFEWWQGSDGPNAGAAFDSWVENKTDLEEFFLETGWVVQWAA